MGLSNFSFSPWKLLNLSCQISTLKLNISMMNNIALQFGFLQIHWYGILVALAFLTGYWLTIHNGKLYGIKQEVLDKLLVTLFIAIIVGARLAYVISKYPFFIANPWEIIRIDHGGLRSHGAMIVAMIFGCFMIWFSISGT